MFIKKATIDFKDFICHLAGCVGSLGTGNWIADEAKIVEVITENFMIIY
jgi:hypothetical protein